MKTQQEFSFKLIPDDDKELISALKKIEKKSTSLSGYVANQVQLIENAAYLNADEKVTSKMISEESSFNKYELEEMKKARFSLLSELYESTRTAFEDSYLNAIDFMDLEQLIFSIKERENG